MCRFPAVSLRASARSGSRPSVFHRLLTTVGTRWCIVGQSVGMVTDRALLRLAELQFGLVARYQAVARIGLDRSDTMLRRGPFERVDRGVYRALGAPRLAIQPALSAALRVGPGAAVTGPAALALYEVDGFGLLQDRLPFEVLLPPGRRVTGSAFPVRSDPDPSRAVATWGEIRVVGPIDGLIDSAAFLDEVGARWLRLAHDVLRWRGMLKSGRLQQRIAELGAGAPGGSALAGLLELDDQTATGDGERCLGRLLARFDPPPEPQVWVRPDRRLDWYFRSLRYGWEYQGSVDHGTVTGRQADAIRDAELRREGVRIGYVTDADLADEATFLATAAGALSARAYELGVDAPRLRG
jgi:hypothetical protein